MSCKWFRGRVYFLVVMNIFRTLSEDKRMLFNVTYKEGTYNTVDQLGVHLLEENGRWSPALPLCHFPEEEIEHMVEHIEVTLNKAI